MEVQSIVSIGLANLIRLCHVLLILYVILMPMIGPWYFLPGHIGFSFLLMGHWITNNNVCAWSEIESRLRGIPVTDSFVYSIIKPMFDSGRFHVGERTSDRKLFNQLVWGITILACIVSCIRLSFSEDFKEASKDPKKFVQDVFVRERF